MVRGELRRTGYRGVSLRGTGAWDAARRCTRLWQRDGIEAVHARLAEVPAGFAEVGTEQENGATRRRVLVHSSGFQMSPYADIKPAGEEVKQVARKLWHRSPGSPG